MAGLRLTRLPDRTPVKLTLSLTPELQATLVEYGRHYAEAYGVEEGVADLASAMLASFLESDREFAKRRRGAA